VREGMRVVREFSVFEVWVGLRRRRRSLGVVSLGERRCIGREIYRALSNWSAIMSNDEGGADEVQKVGWLVVVIDKSMEYDDFRLRGIMKHDIQYGGKILISTR
jgi:hypothetical protein